LEGKDQSTVSDVTCRAGEEDEGLWRGHQDVARVAKILQSFCTLFEIVRWQSCDDIGTAKI
jgi:hypothetical protein